MLPVAPNKQKRNAAVSQEDDLIKGSEPASGEKRYDTVLALERKDLSFLSPDVLRQECLSKDVETLQEFGRSKSGCWEVLKRCRVLWNIGIKMM